MASKLNLSPLYDAGLLERPEQPLSEIERFRKQLRDAVNSPISAPAEKSSSGGYGDDLVSAGLQGGSRTTAALGFSLWLAGGDPNADAIASHFKESSRPDYMKKYDATILESDKKILDAEGFWATTGAIAETIYNLSDPKALGYTIVENLANMVPSLSLGLTGGVSGGALTGGVGTIPGFLLGMSAGTIATEAGNKGLELLQEWGADMTDPDSIRAVMNQEGFKDEAKKQGIIKGSIIALVDAASFKVGGAILSGPGKRFVSGVERELANAGVDTANREAVSLALKNKELRKSLAKYTDDFIQEMRLPSSVSQGINRAASKYASSQTFRRGIARGAGALGVESVSEAAGEFSGEFGASGEAKPAEAILEGMSSLGQSTIQASISKSLYAPFKLTSKETKALSGKQGAKLSKILQRLQRQRVSDGKDSGIDPSDINDSRINISDESRDIVEGIDSTLNLENQNIVDYEEIIGDIEDREALNEFLSLMEQEEGFSAYHGQLKQAVRDRFGSSVPLYVSIPPEDPVATDGKESGGLKGLIVGSIDPNGIDSRKGYTVIRAMVPVESIRSRGQAGRGQFVVDAEALEFEQKDAPQPTKAPSAKPLQKAAEKKLKQIQQDEQIEVLEKEFVEGQKDVQTEGSQKFDSDKATRRARLENKKKQKKVPEIEELRAGYTYEGKRITRPSLGKIVTKNKIPTDEGRGRAKGDFESIRVAVSDYRNALDSPDQIAKVNKVLGRVGYKLVKKGKTKELSLRKIDGFTWKGNKKVWDNDVRLGSTRVQDKTIDQYLDTVESIEQENKTKQDQTTKTQKEKSSLGKTIEAEKRRVFNRGRVEALENEIEEQFVSRTDKGVFFDEEGASDFINKQQELKSGEVRALRKSLARFRKETEISPRKSGRRTSVVVHTSPSDKAKGTKRVSKLRGTKRKRFHADALRIIRTGTRDALLGKIARVFLRHGNVGATGRGGEINPNSILTLSKTTDKNKIAKVYALASAYIYLQDSVSWSRPDNSLDVESDSTSVGVHFKTHKNLNNAQFGKLYAQIRRTVGDDAVLIRLSHNEYIVHNFGVTKSQFARRVGRMKQRYGSTYGIKKAEFFTSKAETVEHNWAEDPSGEGLRDQIRAEGFGDLLEFVDSKRGEFLDLAEDYGADVSELRFSVDEEVVETEKVVEAESETEGQGVKLSLGGRRKRAVGKVVSTKSKSGRSLEELEKAIPPRKRVSRRHIGQRKTIRRKKFSSLDLDKKGVGAPPGLTQTKLDQIWNDALDETDNSVEAKQTTNRLKMAPRDLGFWSDALKLPDRARFWYEISAETFEDVIRVSDKDDLRRFIAIVAATSPKANPHENMRLAMSAFSQYLSGSPMDVPVLIQESVKEAIRDGALGGLKTGSFAGTMQFILGLDKTPPLSTNDRQVARTFGIEGGDIAKNPILYETISRFYIKLRDELNSNLPDRAEPFETWQLQALGWVEERAISEGASTREDVDDYQSALLSEKPKGRQGVLSQLRSAGVITGNHLSEKDLKSSKIPIILMPSVVRYREQPKQTIEINSPPSQLKGEGAQLQEEVTELLSLALDQEDAVAIREYHKIMGTVLRKAGRGERNPFNLITASVLGKEEYKLTRLQYPSSAYPFDYSGTWEGEVSPNLRVPMPAGMSRNEVRTVMAFIGKAWSQAAMAHSKFKRETRKEIKQNGGVETYSVFVATTDDLGADSKLFSEFGSAVSSVSSGYSVNIERWANGYSFHISPDFDGNTPAGIARSTINSIAKRVFGEYSYSVFLSGFYGDYIEAQDIRGANGSLIVPGYGTIIGNYRQKLIRRLNRAEEEERNNAKGGHGANRRRDRRTLGDTPEGIRGRIDNLDSGIKRAEEIKKEFEQGQGEWIKKYSQRIRDRDKTKSVKPSMNEKPVFLGGLSVSGLRAILVKRFGDGISHLEEAGILRIVDRVPEHLISNVENEVAEARSSAEGLFVEATNTSYLIASNIREEDAVGVLMHEVGTHFGLKRMVGNSFFGDILMHLSDNKEKKEFAPYFRTVRRAYRSLIESGKMVEDSEEFLEEVLAKIAQDPNASKISIIEEMFRRIKVFLSKYLAGVTLNARDLQSLVLGSLRLTMRGKMLRQAGIDRVYASRDKRRTEFEEGSNERMIVSDEVTNLFRTTDKHYNTFPDKPQGYNNSFERANGNNLSNFVSRYLDAGQTKLINSGVNTAFKELNEIFSKLKINPKNGYLVDFDTPNYNKNSNQHLRSYDERIVRVYNKKDKRMLIFRFGVTPRSLLKNAASPPILDFFGIANNDINYEHIKQAVMLFKNGKLKEHNGLSAFLTYKLGTKRPTNESLNRDLFTGRRITGDFNRITMDQFLGNTSSASAVTAYKIAMELGEDFRGEVNERESGVSLSLRSDLSDEANALIPRITGSERSGSLLDFLGDIRREGFLWFTQGAIDSYRSIRNKLGDEGERAWQMMHLSDNSAGILHSALHFGRPVERSFNGKFDGYDIDPSGSGLLQVLESVEGEVDYFLGWIAGVRAERLLKQGREKNFSKEDIKNLKSYAKGTMDDGRSRALVYAKAARDLGKFQSSILDLAMNAGVISVKDRMSLSSNFYLPFYREIESNSSDSHVRGPSMSGDFVNVRDVIHKLEGSELEVDDLLQNILMNWHALLNASMKNRAGSAAVSAAVGQGIGRRLTDKKEISQISFSKRKSKSDKYEKYVYVLENGEKVWYEIGDHMVLQSLMALNWTGPNGNAVRTLSTFKRVFTMGVTASPAFKIRNLIRDTLHTAGVGKVKYNIFGNVGKGLSTAQIGDPVYRSMLAGGGAFSFGHLNDDPSAIRRMVASGVKEAHILNTPAKLKSFLAKGIDVYAEFGNRMENANRAALYLNRVGEVGHLQASFEARDLLNFSSHGRWVATQWIISSIPFLNARLQGLDKLARAGGDRSQRAQMATVIGTLVLASVLYELSAGDDEDYKKLEDWKRDTYWPVKIPGSDDWFFIPKPFEIGAITSVAQRFTQQFIDDSVDPKFFAGRVMEIISDQLAFDWRPQMFKPIQEVATNYDSFRDRRIESLGDMISGKPKFARKQPHSSELAIHTSELMHDLTAWVGADNPLSPVQIDHLIKGYFGWLGATTVGILDYVFSPDAPAPTRRLDEYRGLIPIAGFIGKTPLKNTRQASLFWEQLYEIRALKSERDHYIKHGLDEELKEFLVENKEILKWRSLYERVQRRIGKVGKKIQRTYDSKVMSPDEKRLEIDRLTRYRNSLGERLVEKRRLAEQQ